jgi:hypothetical protein
VGDAATCARAIDDFKRVYSMSPDALGALRDLAYTERGLGRIASAATHFRELATKAPNDPKPERRAWAKFAAREADSLSARVPSLTVRVSAPVPTGLAVSVDGAAIAAVDAPMALDPGGHQLHAEAPGFQPFDELVHLEEHDQDIVEVQLAPKNVRLPVVVPSSSTTSSSKPSPSSEKTETHHSRVVPLIVTLTGGGVVGVGLGFGIAAFVQTVSNCDSQKMCDGNSLPIAHSLADISTVLVVAGSVVMAGGIVWYFLIPPDSGGGASAHTVGITATPRSVNAVFQF